MKEIHLQLFKLMTGSMSMVFLIISFLSLAAKVLLCLRTLSNSMRTFFKKQEQYVPF